MDIFDRLAKEYEQEQTKPASMDFLNKLDKEYEQRAQIEQFPMFNEIQDDIQPARSAPTFNTETGRMEVDAGDMSAADPTHFMDDAPTAVPHRELVLQKMAEQVRIQQEKDEAAPLLSPVLEGVGTAFENIGTRMAETQRSGISQAGSALARIGRSISTGLPSTADMQIVNEWMRSREASEVRDEVMKLGRSGWDEFYNTVHTGAARWWKAPLAHWSRSGMPGDEWAGSLAKSLEIAIQQPYAAPGQTGTPTEFIAQSIGSAIPSMLGSILATALTGSPFWGGGSSQALLYSDQVYDEEMESGASHQEAMWSAGLTGLITGVVGGLQMKGWTRFGQGHSVQSFVNAARENAMMKIGKMGASFTFDMLKGATKSAIQEAMQEATVVYTPHLTRGKDIDFQDAKHRISRAALGGGIASFAAGPISSAITTHNHVKTAHKINQDIDSMVTHLTDSGNRTKQAADGSLDQMVQQAENVEEGRNPDAAIKKTFMKGFAARLTSIRNNADNILAGAGKRPQQVEAMRGDLIRVLEHYSNITDTIADYPALFGELQQVQDILPDYADAVQNFIAKPTKEMFGAIKDMGDRIGDLGQKYADRISSIEVTPEQRQQAAEDQALGRWVDNRMKSFHRMLQRAEAGDATAQTRVQELRQNYQVPTREILDARAAEGDVEAQLMLDNQEFAGGENEIWGSARLEARQQMPTHEALLARANEGDSEAKFLIETTREAPEKTVEHIDLMDDPRTPDRNTMEGAEKYAKDLRGRLHQVARRLGMKDAARRKMMKQLVDKDSAADMNASELETVIQHMESLGDKKGIKPTKVADDATAILKDRPSRYKTDNLLPGQHRRGLDGWKDKIRRGLDNYWDGQKRIERWIEAIDGYKDGFLSNVITKVVNRASMNAIEAKAARQKAFIGKAREVFGDNADALLTQGRTTVAEANQFHSEIKLDPVEKMAFYIYARNPDSLKHILDAHLGDQANPEMALQRILESVTEQEAELANWIVEDIDAHYDGVNYTHEQAFGEGIERLDNYFPMYFEGVDVEFHKDPLSELLAKSDGKRYQEHPAFAKARKGGSVQKLSLDLLGNYINHIDRVEQFTSMAPAVKQVADILGDNNFRKEFARTQGDHAVKIMDKWLKDSARGHAADVNGWAQKALMSMRRNGMVYALGYNVPSVARQLLSNFNAMAVHPSVMSAYASNMAAIAKSPIKARKAMQDFVFEKSPLIRTRNADDIIDAMDRQATPAMKIKGKVPWSKRALSWIRFTDRETVVMAWKSLYDSAMNSETVMSQYGLDGSEKAAIEFADKMIGRTQPVSQVHQLPDFFRGGVVERMLSTFTNQVNNNLQFWAHDILGEYRAGHISADQVAYRVMMSYVIPSQLFGAIGRGRLPESWGEAGFDMMTYGLSTPFMVGRILSNVVQGRYGQTGLETAAIHNAGLVLHQLMQGELAKAGKSAIRSGGAATGKFPAQWLRTGQGAYRLFNGETDDLRELIWSEFVLNQSAGKDESVPYEWQTGRR